MDRFWSRHKSGYTHTTTDNIPHDVEHLQSAKTVEFLKPSWGIISSPEEFRVFEAQPFLALMLCSMLGLSLVRACKVDGFKRWSQAQAPRCGVPDLWHEQSHIMINILVGFGYRPSAPNDVRCYKLWCLFGRLSATFVLKILKGFKSEMTFKTCIDAPKKTRYHPTRREGNGDSQ